MIEDAELLRRYAEGKSEAAFAELVERHLNFVYAGALRRVGGDTQLAEDVTQQVFVALARAAAPLSRRPVLAGWLYTTTHFASAQVVRTERRRQAREQEAHLMHEISTAPSAAAEWERLRPVLDDTMDELDDGDREAVLLRFFEGRSFADVGEKLRLTENAARMRVERALDKMHALLARRGVTSTTAALALALASQSGVAAPAGLGATVTTAALAGGAVAGGGAAIGTKFLIFMSTTKTVTGIAAAIAVLAIGTAVYEANEIREIRVTLTAAERQRDDVNAQLRALAARMQKETAHAQAAEDDNAKLLKAVEETAPARAAQIAAANAPITHDMVAARYKRAQELARSGDAAAALKEFLWCFEEGMPRVTGYGGVRLSYLLSEIEKAGPAGIAALRDLRDKAQKRMIAGENDFDAASEFAAINHTLKEDDLTIAIYDQLPPGDSRRKTLAGAVYEQLVSSQRYVDAAQARPYATMSSLFEANLQERPLPAGIPDPTSIRKAQRDYLVSSTAKCIEVLAGAGDFDHARTLATRLLAYDGSESTKALIQEHATRAGHPELLTPAPKP